MTKIDDKVRKLIDIVDAKKKEIKSIQTASAKTSQTFYWNEFDKTNQRPVNFNVATISTLIKVSLL